MAGHGDGTDRDDPTVLVTLGALVTEAMRLALEIERVLVDGRDRVVS